MRSLPAEPRSAHPALRAAIVLVVALLVQVPALVNPTWFVDDDPHFYLVIAQHIVAGDGSTFDGVVPTNGYHPLWMAVCVAIVALAPGSPLTAALAVSVTGYAVAMAWLDRLAVRLGLADAALATGLLAPLLLGSTGFVSEMALSAVLHAAVVAALLVALRGGRAWPVGAALGLLFLARLDTVFLVAFAALLVAWRRGLRSAAVVGLVAAVVVAPYLAANLAAFGHLVPISGALKSTFPAPDLHAWPEKLGTWGLLSLWGGALAAIVGLVDRAHRDRGDLVALLGLGAVAQAGYVACFGRPDWQTDWVWYWVTGMVAACWGAARLLEELRRRGMPSFREDLRIGRGLGALAVGVAALGNLAAAFVVPGVSSRHEAGVDHGPPFGLAAPRVQTAVAAALREGFPPGTRITVFDLPGILAFYSGLPISAVDGLTADFATLDRFERDGLTGVLDAHDARCVLLPRYDYDNGWMEVTWAGERATVSLRSPRRDGPVSVHTFDLVDARLRSEDLPGRSTPFPWFAVWDAPGRRCPAQ